MNPDVELEFIDSLELWAREWETALQRVLEGQDGALDLVGEKSHTTVKFNPYHDARGRFAEAGGGGAAEMSSEELLRMGLRQHGLPEDMFGGPPAPPPTNELAKVTGDNWSSADLHSTDYIAQSHGGPQSFAELATDREIASIYQVPGTRVVVLKNAYDKNLETRFIRADIYDEKTGVKLARIERDFDGPGRYVHHDLFSVVGNAQGEGFAARVNARAEDYYRAAGFEKITLMADIDVGKYAWARQGYDVAKNYRTNFLEDAHGYTVAVLRSANPRLTKAAAAKRADKLLAGKTHSWEIAALDDGKKYPWSSSLRSGEGHLGKAVLLRGSLWYGEKSLLPGAAESVISDAYYRQKGAK